MLIFPAIDIKNGECVRLKKGDMNTAHKVAENFLDTALSFKQAGAAWIHMVDLDGAVNGKRINTSVFTETAAKSGLKVEVGGGIRKAEDVEYYLSRGIERVIIGSAALNNPQLVSDCINEYGSEKIVLGIDARNGMVAAEGWVKTSEISYIELAKRMEEKGVKYIIFTDIGRDGMLSGPNLEQLFALNDAVSCNIVASGGIKDIEDIKAVRDGGLYGVICGKSIYSGTLSLKEAVKVGGEQK